MRYSSSILGSWQFQLNILYCTCFVWMIQQGCRVYESLGLQCHIIPWIPGKFPLWFIIFINPLRSGFICGWAGFTFWDNHKPYQWPCHDLSTSIDLLRWLWVFSAKRPRNGRTPNPSRSTMHLPKARRAKRRGSEMAVRLLLHVIIMVFNVDISRHEHSRTSMKYNEIMEVSRWCRVVWAPCCVCHLTSSHAKFCLSCQRQQRTLLNLQDGQVGACRNHQISKSMILSIPSGKLTLLLLWKDPPFYSWVNPL